MFLIHSSHQRGWMMPRHASMHASCFIITMQASVQPFFFSCTSILIIYYWLWRTMGHHHHQQTHSQTEAKKPKEAHFMDAFFPSYSKSKENFTLLSHKFQYSNCCKVSHTCNNLVARALIQYKDDMMTSYQYRTVVRSSYLHNGIFYAGKMISLYWIRPKVIELHWNDFTIKFEFLAKKALMERTTGYQIWSLWLFSWRVNFWPSLANY